MYKLRNFPLLNIHRQHENIGRLTNRFRSLIIFIGLLVLGLCAVVGNAYAHADGENYIWLSVEQDHISGRVELNEKDIKSKLGIDFREFNDSALDPVKIESVKQYILESFQLIDGESQLEVQLAKTQRLEDNTEVIQFYFSTTTNPSSHVLTIQNTLFLDESSLKNDRLHKSLVLIEHNRKTGKFFGDEYVALVFDSREPMQTLDTENPPSYHPWKDFFRQGILHILYGFDHVLFVITLLLTSAMVFQKGVGWEVRPKIRSVVWLAVKLLTVFTIAHSATLALSVLGIINVNILLAEIIIVVSILVVALNNIKPVFSHESLLLVFVFGLFHGVGFASVMNQLAFRNVYLDRIVVLFNLGIEFGQLLIALVMLPLVILASRHEIYRTLIMQLLSAVIVVISCYWLLQRIGLI